LLLDESALVIDEENSNIVCAHILINQRYDFATDMPTSASLEMYERNVLIHTLASFEMHDFFGINIHTSLRVDETEMQRST
jgi:hypothetical protein